LLLLLLTLMGALILMGAEVQVEVRVLVEAAEGRTFIIACPSSSSSDEFAVDGSRSS